jgi:response regulator RpfG family c-di-GMP phosphodiesterase
MIADDWLRRNSINQGTVTQSGMDQALERQQREGGELFDNLIAVRAASESALLSLVAQALNTRYVSMQQLARVVVPETILAMVPKELAEEHTFLPVSFDTSNGVLVAVAPDQGADYVMVPLLEPHGVTKIRTYIGAKRSVRAAIKKLYFGDFYAFDRVDTTTQDEYRQMMDMYSHNLLDAEQLASAEPEQVDPNEMAIFSGPELEQLSRQERSESQVIAVDAWGDQGDWLRRYQETLKILVNRIEMSMDWRQGHSAEAERLAGLVSKRIGQSTAAMDATALAALLHECGKPRAQHYTLHGVAHGSDSKDQVGRMVDAPRRAMESALLPPTVLEILSSLHERFDGLGVPGRLSGRAIPLGARILAVVDEYLGLLYDPAHSAGTLLDRDAALAELGRHVGTLYDASVVEILKQTVTGDSLRQEFLGNRASLLLVDSDPEELTGLELKLVAEGYTVLTARTSAQAARKVLGASVDLIITETTLEPVDGFALCERLQKDGRTAPIPVVFLSDRADADSVNRGFSLGAKDYIVKPYAFELLLAKIQRTLETAPAESRTQSRGVSGSLSEMSLPDIIQILSAGRKSGALKVSYSAGEGIIFFQEGRIVDAESSAAWGEEAVYALLTVGEGDFELDSRQRASQITITGSTEGLLLEGMRRYDEAQAGR